MPITKAAFGGRSEERGMPMAVADDEEEASRTDVTIKGKKGQKPLTFKKGGLHETLGVPAGEPIPADKMDAAKAGKYGPKAAQQADFAANVLKQGQKTAAANRRSEGRGTLPPALKANEFKKGDGERVLGPGVPVVPTAILGSNKKRPKGGK